MKIYMVGGSIRDELLGKHSKDRDFVVFGCTEEEFFKRFPRAIKVGKKIPVYLVGRDEYTISEYDNIMDDLMSRDLTINAIARDEKGRLYHHPLALEDLKNKVLRPISLENFRKDPLRVYRIARFYAQLPDFSVDRDSMYVVEEVGKDESLMRKIPKERIANEVLKVLRSKKPSNFFSFLIDEDITTFWFQELEFLKKGHEWKQVMDIAIDYVEAWMGLCYGFLQTCKDRYIAKKNVKNMGIRIGLPKRILMAGKSFVEYFYEGKDIFSLDAYKVRDLIYLLYRQKLIRPFFRTLEYVTQANYLEKVELIEKAIKNTKLPHKYRNLGPMSGKILRDMQTSVVKKCLDLM